MSKNFRSTYNWSWTIIILVFVLYAGACTFTKTVVDGDSAFKYKQYAKATEYYLNEYNASNRREIRAEKAFYLGLSYDKMNNQEKALEWFIESDQLNYGNEATKSLANAYKKQERYDDAISIWRKYEREGGPIAVVRREITICEQAKEWLKFKSETPFTVKGVDINTPFAEYAPVLYDGDYLVFTSDREESTGEEGYLWTGNNYSDLFIVRKDDLSPLSFDDNINTTDNEGAACFNKDFTEMFFTRCKSNTGDDFCKILWCKRTVNGWSEPTEPFFMESNYNYGQPTLIENDSVLVFSSDIQEGKGGYDLFYSVKEENGWSEVFPMPESINTEGNEKFPVGKGDTLFFSSDFLPGLGGLDLFFTYLRSGGEWAPPENMKAPINSGGDDFSLIIDPQASLNKDVISSGYFSSSRKGVGNDDIYKFEQHRENKTEIPDSLVAEVPEAKSFDMYLAIRVLEKEFSDPENPNSEVIRKNPIENSKISVLLNGNEKESLSTTPDGRVILELEANGMYDFKISKIGYLNQRTSFSTFSINPESFTENRTFNIEVVLDKIYIDTEIVLENIYYDYNESFIREDAKPSLDSLSEILKINPEIRIQLSSHTDCRGEDDYNLQLSQRRAQAAIEYLISVGIEISRLEAKGYGESIPAINCICEECNENEHQVNRRTAFRIIGLKE